MKKLILLVLLAVPAFGTITVVQVKPGNANCTGTSGFTCGSDTLSATATVGNYLIFGGITNTAVTWSAPTDSHGNTWSAPVSCVTSDGTQTFSWAKVTQAGTNNAQMTISVSGKGRNAILWEVSITGSSLAFDVCGSLSGVPGAANQPGPALTLSGTFNDIIFTAAADANLTSISAPYTGFATFAASPGRGYAYSPNTLSGAAPTWATGSSPFTVAAIAMKEIQPTGSAVVY